MSEAAKSALINTKAKPGSPVTGTSILVHNELLKAKLVKPSGNITERGRVQRTLAIDAAEEAAFVSW